jgi:hypothetical protein
MSDSGKECTTRPPIKLLNVMLFNELRSLESVAHGLAYLD